MCTCRIPFCLLCAVRGTKMDTDLHVARVHDCMCALCIRTFMRITERPLQEQMYGGGGGSSSFYLLYKDIWTESGTPGEGEPTGDWAARPLNSRTVNGLGAFRGTSVNSKIWQTRAEAATEIRLFWGLCPATLPCVCGACVRD